MPVNVQVFGSTSSGNCTALWNGGGALLVDCGLGLRYTDRCLQAAGLDWPGIRGVLLTHTHSDHADAHVLARLARTGVPLFCHRGTVAAFMSIHTAAAALERSGLIRLFDDDPFEVDEFVVAPFAVPHDAPGGSHGFAVSSMSLSAKVVVSTDLGGTSAELAARFADAEAIVLESNHDRAMLRNSGRPRRLQQRIIDAHLCNEECADFLGEVVARSSQPPRAVVLAHVSQKCNTNELARACTAGRLAAAGAHGTRIIPTHKCTPSAVVTVA